MQFLLTKVSYCLKKAWPRGTNVDEQRAAFLFVADCKWDGLRDAIFFRWVLGRRTSRVIARGTVLFSRRGVIRFLLERNISYRRSRCVNSLIRGDKYRRDISPKQTTRADRRRRGSETRKWDKRVGGKGAAEVVEGVRRRARGREGDKTWFYVGIRWTPSPRETSIATAGGPRSNCLPDTGQSGVPIPSLD